jgi:hypothetical protein
MRRPGPRLFYEENNFKQFQFHEIEESKNFEFWIFVKYALDRKGDFL